MTEHLISIEEAESDLLACATRLAENVKSAEGHAEALKTIVPLYLRKWEVDLAAQLADTVSDPFTRDRLLISVAEKCTEIDDEDYAFQLAEAIEDIGLQGEALEKIAIQQILKGNIEKASETAEVLDHPDNVYTEMAVHFAGAGNLQKADEAINSIAFPTARAFALQTVAVALLERQKLNEAVEILERAFSAAAEIDFETDEIRAFTEIGNLFIEARRLDRAIETFDKARQIAEKIDTAHREYLLSAISLGFFHAGSLDLADRTLDLIQDKTQISSTLVGFAVGFWEKDEKKEALEALTEAYQILKSQSEKETRDSRAKFRLFRTIAVQFAVFEKYEQAIEIAHEIVDETEQTAALLHIIQLAAVQGKDDWAEQIVKSLNEDADRTFAYINLSDAKEKLGAKEEALSFLDEAAHVSGTIPQLFSRSAACNELIKRFLEYGKNDRAREIFTENLETIAQIRDESLRAVALANLSEVAEKAEFTLTNEEREILRAMIRRAEW